MKDNVNINVQIKKKMTKMERPLKRCIYVSHYNVKPELVKTQFVLLKKKCINRVRLTASIQLQKLYTYKPMLSQRPVSSCVSQLLASDGTLPVVTS